MICFGQMGMLWLDPLLPECMAPAGCQKLLTVHASKKFN